MRAAGAEALCENVEVRRTPEPVADATLRFAGAGWKEAPAGRALLERLAAAPWCRSPRAKGGRLTLLISDEHLAELGSALETGAPAGLDCSDLLAGRTMFVDFYGANTTKALHVGHLRNLAIGHAYAAASRAAGARVTTQSHGSDFGRQMSEATAGYVRFRDGQTPETAGLKPDHFVGDCYSRYVADLAIAGGSGAAPVEDAPIAREMEPVADLADRHLDLLRAGDPEARALWLRLREWAIAGQASTLARLGITLDRLRFESTSLPLGERIVADGLARGILGRLPDGSVIFDTGRGEYRRMLLVRRDGLPTAHLRDFICLGVMMRESDDPLDAYVQFCGDEWSNAVTVYRELLGRLHPRPFNALHQMVFHGLVQQAGVKVKSSGLEPLLADEILDRLTASEPVGALLAASGAPLTAGQVAAMVALVHFAASPPAATIEFALESFLEQRDQPGWVLASAYCRAHRTGVAGGADPDPNDPAYRFAVLQSQRLRSTVESVVTQHDPSRLVRYLVHLARFYLDETRTTPRLDRVVRTLLGAGLAGLGLAPKQS